MKLSYALHSAYINQSIYGQDDKVNIQFDHVNGKPLKKETRRSTFVRAVQTLPDWFFKFDIKAS